MISRSLPFLYGRKQERKAEFDSVALTSLVAFSSK